MHYLQTFLELQDFISFDFKSFLPEVWSSIHEVKDLGRVQQLFESSEELHTLVVATFRIDKDQQWACAGWRARGLPEA